MYHPSVGLSVESAKLSQAVSFVPIPNESSVKIERRSALGEQEYRDDECQ